MKEIYFPAFPRFERIQSNHNPLILIDDPKSKTAVSAEFQTVLLNYLGTDETPADDGLGLFYVTRAELIALELAEEIKPGYFYYITDKDILLQGVLADKVTLHGSLYVKVAPTQNEVDYVEYDLTNDIILRRRDKRGNDVAMSKEYLDSATLPYTTIDEFYWLNDLVYGNTIVDSYVLLNDGVNAYAGKFNNNFITNRSVVDVSPVVSNPANIFTANTINAGQVVVTADTDIFQVYNNNILNGSTVSQNAGSLFTLYDNTLSDYSHISQNSSLTNSSIAFNTITSNSSVNITEVAGGGARTFSLTYTNLANNSQFDCTLASGNGSSLGYSNINSDSYLSFSSVNGGAFNSILLENQSAFSVTSKTNLQNVIGVSVKDRSTFTITSFSSAAAMTDIVVENSSTFTMSSTSGTINNIFIGDNAAVTLTSNTTNKSNLVIKRWTVTLHAGTAHTSGTLDVSSDSSFTPVYRSTITQFVDANSVSPVRWAANSFIFIASTADVYTGFYYIYNSGGKSIDTFTNPSVPTTNMAIIMTPGTAEVLTFVQDAVPVAVGGIAMNVASIALNGQDGQIPSDTLTLQKTTNQRFAVINYFNFT
jgi:hypothetical protein